MTADTGGYAIRVSYYAGNKSGFTGAHLFNDERDAKKFCRKWWWKSPTIQYGKRMWNYEKKHWEFKWLAKRPA